MFTFTFRGYLIGLILHFPTVITYAVYVPELDDIYIISYILADESTETNWKPFRK